MSEQRFDLKKLPEDVYQKLVTTRWRCRTDLKFLCNEVLGFKDVSEELHGPVIANLQQFPLPDVETQRSSDRIIDGKWYFTSPTRMLDLEGRRRMLLIDSRGFLKTTINIIAHTIQWIINYPDIALLIVQSNSAKAEAFLREIKQHFQGNPRLRALFPEHCPMKRIMEWGTQTQFTSEARSITALRREPTVVAGSIDKGMAGYHFDLIKFSDIVDPSNITGNGLQQVKDSFGMMHNLLISPLYWIDVEGTRYHMDDLYGKIIEDEDKATEDMKEWNMFIRGATFREWGGKPEEYTMEALLTRPEVIDKDGLPKSRWPTRFPNKDLASMKRKNRFMYMTQQQQLPMPTDGDAYFPVNHAYPTWISRKDFKQNIRVAAYEITVDTAETINKKADYTVIIVAAWSGNGKCYIDKIIMGQFLPDQTISKILNEALTHYGKLRSIKIEETGYVRGMKSSLQRKMDMNGITLPITFVKRDTQVGKEERIAQTLQPPYRAHELIFLDDLGLTVDSEEYLLTKSELLEELKNFPAAKHDDILDAISDLWQNKGWHGREFTRRTLTQEYDTSMARLLGLDDEYSIVNAPRKSFTL